MSQPQFDISSTTEVVCEHCGNNTFKPIFFLRKLSRFLSPDGLDKIIPIDSLACDKCGHVNADFKPISQIEDNTNNLNLNE